MSWLINTACMTFHSALLPPSKSIQQLFKVGILSLHSRDEETKAWEGTGLILGHSHSITGAPGRPHIPLTPSLGLSLFCFVAALGAAESWRAP